MLHLVRTQLRPLAPALLQLVVRQTPRQLVAVLPAARQCQQLDLQLVAPLLVLQREGRRREAPRLEAHPQEALQQEAPQREGRPWQVCSLLACRLRGVALQPCPLA